MLVLTRRIGESILIGDNIRITVLGIAGGQVRIGTSAPKQVAVNRLEVQERAHEPGGANFATTSAGSR